MTYRLPGDQVELRTDFEFVLGSILNSDLVDGLMARVDVVFHLAAAVGVQLIVEKPLESLATNIRGSEIVIEAAHFCMMMRGVEKQNSRTVTSALRGIFRDDSKTRVEFLRLAHGGRPQE